MKSARKIVLGWNIGTEIAYNPWISNDGWKFRGSIIVEIE